jgi:2-polyprenyl-3-methyl-5-hydroxy-6-metoxy-1,4-benzoquinol methylase
VAQAATMLHHQEFHLIEGHSLSNGYDVVTCVVCGFVYADSQISQDEYDAFYEKMSKYADPQTGTGGGLHAWDADRLWTTAQDIGRFAGPPASRIVDIGCGNGGLLWSLKEQGFQNLIGIEPSPMCVSAARAKGIDVREGLLNSPSALGSFDCIILSGVLEHIQDLRGALENLRSYLNKGGIVYAEVPDASRYAEFLYAPFQDFNTEHINHFSQDTLRTLLAQFQLEPLFEAAKTIRSSETSLYPVIYGVFKHTNSGKDVRIVAPNTQLPTEIANYVTTSERMMSEINVRLEEALGRAREVVIWGTGQLAMKLVGCAPLARRRIVACVDTNPIHHGKTLHGAPIVAPEDLGSMSCPIVITSLLHQAPIARKIQSMGLHNEIVILREFPEIPFQ